MHPWRGAALTTPVHAAPEVPRVELDHLVVAARTLDEGVAWCEALLGVTPAPGGRHALMGTHNRLIALSSRRFPRSYLEIVAIDPAAPPPSRARWFELDRPPIQAAIAVAPRLLHWVARTNRIDEAVAVLRAAGHDPGVPTAAERMTARGPLRWHITLRDDGGRPAGGAVPLLIEWGGEHPCDALPASGVTLEGVALTGVPASLASWFGVDVDMEVIADSNAPAIAAMFGTPRGPTTIASPPADIAG